MIEFSSGYIKVGYTSDFARRLRQYREDARIYGGELVNHWVSDPMADAKTAEADLIAHCARRATIQLRKEFFAGISFNAAVWAARRAGKAR